MTVWLFVLVLLAGASRRRFLANELRLRRECRRFGHVELEDRRGAPVCEFEVCGRCGKMLDTLATWRLPK